MNLGLKNKKALVTGGATGLGATIVEALAREGSDVAFSYHRSNLSGIDAFKHRLEKDYAVKIYPIKADISKEEEVEHLFDHAYEQLGKIDILINNAGVWLSGKVKDMAVEDWDITMAINLKAPFILSKKFVNAAIENDYGGSIVNITSQAAFHGSTTGHAHYAASKAGLVTFAISLAREVAKNKINVNNIAVGIMQTKMIQENLEKDPDYYLERIPQGRVAEPAEIADITIFLASKVASYMTGATIDVTGGMLMR